MPDIGFTSQKSLVGHATVQALTCEDADFDLNHGQPARVLGRAVKARPTQQHVDRSPAQHVVEAFLRVGVQVIQHKVNAACRLVRFGREYLDEADEVGLAPVDR